MSSGVRSIRTARPAPAAAQETLPLDLPRVVSVFAVLALAFALLVPPTAFAGTRSWSLSRTPASVSAGPASVQLTATNTGDDGGGEAVGCVVIAVPSSAFTVTSASIDLVSDGDSWNASFAIGPTWTLVYLMSQLGRWESSACGPGGVRGGFGGLHRHRAERHVQLDRRCLQQGRLHGQISTSPRACR